MKILILFYLLFFNSTPREIENMKFSFPSKQHEIFLDYANDNFSQKLVYNNNIITAEIISSNFLYLDLNFRIFPNESYMANLNRDIKEIVFDLFGSNQSLKTYLNNISMYLKGNISYSHKDLPQDARSVIMSKKANCVGFSNVVSLFLNSAGIENKFVKGFYLKKQDNNTLIPVPHRWVEIHLPNGLKFFYDPQYQDFSANYITTKDNVNFKQVKRFKVHVIKKSKKIIN